MEKFKSIKQKEKESYVGPPNLTASNTSRKRKTSSESSKSKRNRRISNGESSAVNSINREAVETNNRVHHSETYFDQIENLSLRASESHSVDYSDPPKGLKGLNDTDVESRSYSPLSEGLSSNDDDEDIPRSLKNGDTDSFPAINFSTYNLNLTRSSPVTSQANERQTSINNSQEFHKSPSPTNLSVRERQHNNVSSNSMNFKKKHLREQLSLMT